ncbi:MAG: hypothetical protein ACD_63C00060G0008 [uncultured bacterium]|nr:MAG: hypothetical protein ACD_63C00060G0008 [uncultured bacterium]
MESIENKKSILKWEIFGIFVIVFAGSALHFVFEWLGEWQPIAIIAAVNESTWEHLKLAFWPAFIFALVSHPFLKNKTKNFCEAKLGSFYLMPAAIVAFFYSYLIILKEDNLFFDIGIFTAAVIIGQIASYRIMIAATFTKMTRAISIFLIIVILAAFSLLTFFPPKFFLFKDPVTGGYGIVEHKN